MLLALEGKGFSIPVKNIFRLKNRVFTRFFVFIEKSREYFQTSGTEIALNKCKDKEEAPAGAGAEENDLIGEISDLKGVPFMLRIFTPDVKSMNA